MATIFNYETAKYTLVMTGYTTLIILDIWWLGYLLVSSVRWCKKKVKALIQKRKANSSIETE